MLFSARIKELEGQLLAANGERDTLAAQVTALTGERDQLSAANTQCKAQYDADQATITGLTTERDQALQRASDAEANVEAEVTRRLAAAGVDPIKRDPKAVIDNPGDRKAAGSARERLAANFNTQLQK